MVNTSGNIVINIVIIIVITEIVWSTSAETTSSRLTTPRGHAATLGFTPIKLPSPLDIDSPPSTCDPTNTTCVHTCSPRLKNVYPSCHCDKFCHFFSDCCNNYQQCSNQTHSHEFHHILERLSPYSDFLKCSSTDDKDEMFNRYMIRRCPDRYLNPIIRQKCEKITTSEITVLQPVTDVKSGATFRNLYCAQCHYRGLDDVIAWAYDSEKCEEITPHLLVWTYFENRELGEYGFCPPDVLRGVTERTCVDDIHSFWRMPQVEMVNTCRNSTDEMEKNCKVSLDPVFSIKNNKSISFRNIHCAFCNGVSKEELFCPPYENMQRPEIIRHRWKISVQSPRIPSLNDLVQISGTPCAADETKQKTKGQCVKKQKCQLGYEDFKGHCMINILDRYAYENPISTKNLITVTMTVTLPKPLSITVHRHHHLKEIFKQAFEANQHGMLKTGSKTLESVDINGHINDQPLRDGHIFTLTGNLTLSFKVKNTGLKADTILKILESLSVYRHHKYRVYRARYRLFSMATSTPITCRDGELITIIMNKTYLEFLSSHNYTRIYETHLIEYDQTVSIQEVYPKLHLCNLVRPKFQNCSLMNFSKEHFSKDRWGLVSDFGSVDTGNYFLSRDLLFTCIGMIHGKQDLIHAKVLGYITIAGFLISILFLAYTLLTYTLFSSLRTTPGKMIMNLCGILFLATISLLLSKLGVNNNVICSIIGLVQHYLWLTMIVCMNAIAIFTVRTFTAKTMTLPEDTTTSYRIAVAYTYGFPTIMVGICSVIHLSDRYGIYGALTVANSCWIKSRNMFLYAFVAPFSTLLAINLVLFLITSRAIQATRAATSIASPEHEQKWEVSLCVRLSFLMGFTWCFGVLGVFYKSLALNYLFVLANSLTGVYLAVGFMCTRRVLELYKGGRQKYRRPSLKYSSSYGLSSTQSKSFDTRTTLSPSPVHEIL